MLNNNAETTPNNEITVITGSNTLNDLPTAGGMLSPRLICNALTFDNLMNSSVAIIATITPAGIKISNLKSYSKGFSISFGQYLFKKILFFYEH